MLADKVLTDKGVINLAQLIIWLVSITGIGCIFVFGATLKILDAVDENASQIKAMNVQKAEFQLNMRQRVDRIEARIDGPG